MKLATLKPVVLMLPMQIGKTVETRSQATRLRGSAGVKHRQAARKADGYLCRHCLADGFARPGVEVDHITPLEQGGGNEASNLQLLCERHHAAKTDADAKRLPGGPFDEKSRGRSTPAANPPRGFF